MNTTTESEHMFCYMEPIKSIILYLDGVLAVPIILMNLLTIICCIRYHKLRTHTNIIIVSLATNDLLFGLFALLPGIWLRTLDNYSNRFFCVYLMSLGMVSFMISLSNLSLLSLERYLAICHPFQYTKWVTYRTTALSAASCWFISLFIMLLIFIFNEWTEGQACVSRDIIPNWISLIIWVMSVAFFALSVLCYFRVLLVVKKQWKTVSQISDTSPVVERSSIKKATMMIIMFGLFIAFLLPVAFLRLIEIRLPFNRDVATATCLFVTLIKISSFTNFLVYNSCNKLFRKATLHLLCCMKDSLRVPE